MPWVELVSLLALVQFFVFGILVGRARGAYGIKAPATTGNEIFERYYRVQMNTIELLLIFLPALWLAARYWSPPWMAGIGAVYLVGRIVYLRAYVRDPSKRHLGFALSCVPNILLLLMAISGVIRALLKT